MADISTYLAAIMSAVYGEDVRGSIHDAIEIINDVSEVVISAGTAVTSASSSSTGFFEDSLYINTDTDDLWRCAGTDTWTLVGNIKGAKGDTGNTGAAAGFGTPTGSVDSNVGTPSITITASGPDTAKVFDFAFHNMKGEKGDIGNTGLTGNGIYNITKASTSGLVDTYVISYTNGGTTNFLVTNGYNPAVTITTITGGHQVKITDKDHPNGQTFNVMDGSGIYGSGHTLYLN